MSRLAKVENIQYENLKGFEKAAILISYLGKSAAATLFKRMDDTDIRKLINIMAKFRVVPVHVTKKILEEYYEMVSETDEYIFGFCN